MEFVSPPVGWANALGEGGCKVAFGKKLRDRFTRFHSAMAGTQDGGQKGGSKKKAEPGGNNKYARFGG